MSTRTSPWPAGFPCWADLMASDVDRSAAFYGAVLGWTADASDPEQYGGYVVASVGERAAAGMGPVQEGARLGWTLYLASDDADATAAAVEQAGGTVLAPPMEVGPLGRMLVALDPTGATFGVWQALGFGGAQVVNEHGGLTWEDLRSPDPQRAWEFYGAVFGYAYEQVEMAGPDYRTFALPGDASPLGGMGGMFGGETSPHWLVYFGVDDTDAAVVAAEGAGGRVTTPAFDTPYGRMAGLADPDGAVFWVAQVDPAQVPDRTG